MPTEMHKELELNLKILLQVNKRLFRPPHVIEHVANVSIALGDVQGVLAGNLDLDIQGLLIVLQRWLVLTLAVVNNPDVAVALGHIQGVLAAQADLGFQNCRFHGLGRSGLVTRSC